MQTTTILLRIFVAIFGFANIVGAIWFSFSIGWIFVILAALLGVLEFVLAIKPNKYKTIARTLAYVCIPLIVTLTYLAIGNGIGVDWGIIFLRIIELVVILVLTRVAQEKDGHQEIMSIDD